MSKTIVKVVLSNRKARLLQPYDFDCLNEILKYKMPGAEYTPAMKYREWDGYVHMLRRDVMGAGLFLAMRERLEEEANIKFDVADGRIEVDMHGVFEFPEGARDYQLECVEKMRRTKTGGLILGATGVGKTFTIGVLCKGLVGSLLFVVDELTLLKQAKAELEKVTGEEVGEIGDSIFRPRRITVGTIQTIHRHRTDPKYLPWSKALSIIILDEVHLALNKRNVQTVATIQPPLIFGLTATLELKKQDIAMKAYELAGPVIFEYRMEQGVREGFLSKGVAVSVLVENEVELEEFRGGSWWARRNFYMRRYPEEYKKVVVEGKKRNQVIKSLVEEAHEKGKYVIVLVERVKHLKDLSQLLSDVLHSLVLGEKDVAQRVESKAKFESGDVRVILCTKIFKKGVDIKRVDVIIDAAGMKSRNDAVQKYGRGVRLCKEKEGLIFFNIHDIGNRFEKAANGRLIALKKIGVPVFKVSSDLGAEKILELAESKLSALIEAKPSTK